MPGEQLMFLGYKPISYGLYSTWEFYPFDKTDNPTRLYQLGASYFDPGKWCMPALRAMWELAKLRPEPTLDQVDHVMAALGESAADLRGAHHPTVAAILTEEPDRLVARMRGHWSSLLKMPKVQTGFTGGYLWQVWWDETRLDVAFRMHMKDGTPVPLFDFPRAPYAETLEKFEAMDNLHRLPTM